jgi:pimeloyl-ACP methyl ester carboxylesterase
VLWAASSLAIAGVTEVEGEIGPGALYGFYVPDNWNGDVVFWAHGYKNPASPVQLPTGAAEQMRDALVSMGYAFAVSSYSENGYAVKEGVQQTHQLRGLFKSYFGKPGRCYLVGRSMGGGIALMLAEKYPQQYDGALPMCGIVGGTPYQMNQRFTIRALFDYFYPGVVPGTAVYVPEGTNVVTDVYLPVMAAISNDPDPGFDLANVDQVDLQVDDVFELIPAITFNLYLHAVQIHDFQLRTHGHPFFDNSETLYIGSSDDAALNAGVDRFRPVSPPAENYMRHYFYPSGRLQFPVLTLHNARDPVVPISHEELYADAVAAAGASDMLVQQTIDTFGHCEFTEAEMLGAFTDLVNWVETGVKPSP